MAEKRHFGRIRKTATALAVALVALGATVFPISAISAAPTCTLVPTLRDWTVNQGVGSYEHLVRGKTTLVRLYLSKPTCAKDADVIEITGGALTVTGGTTTTIQASTPPLGEVYPQLPPASVAPTNDSPSSPKFVVPGSALDRAADGRFTATFTSSISYRARSAEGVTTTGSVPVPAPGAAAITANIEAKSNPLRVLVVPMGNAAAGMATQFPPAAQVELQKGMAELARMLPVADGVGDLAADVDGGLRYTVLPAMVDLGPAGFNVMPLESDGVHRYCGKASHFSKIDTPLGTSSIRTRLGEYLWAWNSSNPGSAADRVVGVVWEGVSHGIRTSSCEEGRAAINGREAWVRVTGHSSDSLPAMTGPVLAMEVVHTFGGVPLEESDGGYHSPNVEADGTDPDRAYNISLRQFLATDRSAMRIASTEWGNTNALLEPRDWAQSLCVLTPAPPGATAPCSGAGSVGSAAAGTGDSFVIVGSTSGRQPDGSENVEVYSYLAEGPVEHTPPDPVSHYNVVQFAAGAQLGDPYPIPVVSEGSTHNHETPDDRGVFDVTIPAHALAEKFQLRHGTAVLYERQRNNPPAFVTGVDFTTSEPRNFTGDDQASTGPALSPDGKWLAWEDEGRIRVAAADAAPAAGASTLAGTDPAWHQGTDGRYRLVFIRSGDIWVADVNPSSTTPFAFEQLVYASGSQLLPEAAASAPAWSPDGRSIAFAMRGDIWVLATQLLPGSVIVCELQALPGDDCFPVTRTVGVDEANPSWYPGGGSRLVFDRGGTALVVADIAAVVTETDPKIAGSDPVWSESSIVFARSGAAAGLWAVAADPAAPGTPDRLTTGLDTSPSTDRAGLTVAFERPGNAGQPDVFLARLSRSDTVVVLATDESPAELRLDLFVVCGSVVSPFAVNEVPDEVEGSVARFYVSYDDAGACPGGVIRARLTDGFDTATSDLATLPDRGAAPVAAITTPPNGHAILQYEAIPLAGSALNASGATYDWFLTGGAFHNRFLGSGASLGDVPPPLPGGWTPGDYEVTLVVTARDGSESSARASVVIKPDADNDGIEAGKEPCVSATPDPDNDPTNAYGDPDGDGLPSIDDDDPCASAANAVADFDPDTFYVPSSGSSVSVYVTSSKVDLSTIDSRSVAITRVAGYPTRFTLTATGFSKGVLSLKFDRQALATFLDKHDLVGTYVPMVVTGSTASGSFHTVDPTSPVTARG